MFNFIYDTKAFLDAIAVTINDAYKIGLRSGEIDLKLKNFVDKVVKIKPSLGNALRKHQSWIKEVTQWRDALVHKYSTPVAPYGEGLRDPTLEDLKH